MNRKNILLVTLAIIVAIAAPIFLSGIVYPSGQIFLPHGNKILTPSIRIACTVLMAILDYGLAYVFIYFSSSRRKIWFNSVFFFLTVLWNIIIGTFWYIIAVE